MDVQVKAPGLAVEMDVSAELARPGGGGLLRGEGRRRAGSGELFQRPQAGRGRYCWQSWGTCCIHVEGVENYRLLAPAARSGGGDGTLPMLGRVTVTEMEADDDV